MFFKDFVSVKREKIKRGASQTYDTPSLVIGLGEQQDKAWNKINGDKDVPLVQGMLKSAGFKSVTQFIY